MNGICCRKQERRLLSVKQFAEQHGWPIGGLRHLVFHSPAGFENVVRRVGRKVLLDEGAFFEWVDASNKR